MKSLLILTLLALTFCVAACNPRELPGFKQLAKEQEERITRETEEAIRILQSFKSLIDSALRRFLRPKGLS